MEKMYYAAVLLASISLMTSCKQKTGTEQISPIKVKTEKVELTPIAGEKDYSGTVEEAAGSALSFTTGGTIKEIFVSPGQMVAGGTLLAEVDETTIRNAYEATLATRQQAEDAYARMKQLHDNNSLPEIQWVEIQSKLKQAVAAEQMAKKSLNDCKLYAPFGGYISDKLAEIGQNVLPGAPVVKLVKIEQVKVKIAVPENEIASIENGNKVTVRIAAIGDKTYEGTVTERGVTAHSLSRSYEVSALVNNPQKELLPGMICNVCINKDDKQTAIVLPSQIIQLDEQNRTFVWVSEAGKAKKRNVTTAASTAHGIIITQGLQAGDEVITEGQQKLSENMQIEQVR